MKFPLKRVSKSVVLIIEDMDNIDRSKNKDPKSVYKNKQKLAFTLLSDPNRPIKINSGGKILSKKMQKSNISNTKKTANNRLSNNNIITVNDNIFLDCIELQLDNNAIGIIIVVNNTKYIDKPSTPK